MVHPGRNLRRDIKPSCFNSKKTEIFILELNAYVRRPLFIIAFVVFSLLLLFYLAQVTNKKSVSQGSVLQSRVPGKVTSGVPMRLTIPAINVNAAVQRVGVTQSGEMEIPSNTVDVGWFYPGPRPGEKGSAVIAGHFNGENGDAGVFVDLYKLKKGDKLYIEDDTGATTSFVVRESRLYDPGYAEEVFSVNDRAHLNLITCDGVWDGTKKSYTKRLVVFADIAR